MRVRSKRSHRFRYQPEVNLNSFLDLILNVLLFFIFATEIATFQSIEVSVPTSSHSDKDNIEKNDLIIFISKDNKINVNGTFMNVTDLEQWLSKNKTQNTFVIIRGDLKSELQSMVDVLFACRKAQIDKVKVETRPPSNN